MQSVKQVLIHSVDASDADNLQVKSLRSNLISGGITLGTWGVGLAGGYLAYKAATGQDVSLTELKSDFSTYCRVVKSMFTLWNEDSRAIIGEHPIMAASVIAIPGLMAGTFFGTRSHIKRKALEYYKVAHPATDPDPNPNPNPNPEPQPEDDNPLPQPSPQSPVKIEDLTLAQHIELAKRQPQAIGAPGKGQLIIQEGVGDPSKMTLEEQEKNGFYTPKQLVNNPNLIFAFGENLGDKQKQPGAIRGAAGGQAYALHVLGKPINRANTFGFATMAGTTTQLVDKDIEEIKRLVAEGHHVVLPWCNGEISIGRGIALSGGETTISKYIAQEFKQLCADLSSQVVHLDPRINAQQPS
jgi:hypothetical protein